MLQKLVIRFVAVAMVLYGVAACGAQGVGGALEDAMKSRSTGSIEEVTAKFQAAAGQTSDLTQKGFVLTALAEFLMEKEEWLSAAGAYQQVMREGAECNIPGACYGAAQAYMMLDQQENARELCKILKARYPKSGIEEFANQMKADAPDSIHAQLADYLAEFEGVSGDIVDMKTAAPAEQLAAVVPEAPTAVAEPEKTPVASGQEAVETPVQAPEQESGKPRLSLELRGWQSDLSGSVESKGMNLDAESDASFSDQTRFAMKAAWRFSSRNQLRLDYMQFDHSGRLTKNVTFDGLNYGLGASMDIESRFFDVGLARLLSESEDVSWQLLYGGKFSHAFMHVEQRISGGFRSGELTQDIPIPYIGVEGRGKLSSNAAVNASLKYFALNQGETSGRLTDLDIALLVGPDYVKKPAVTEWYGTLGYRYFLLHGKTTDETVEVRYAGPTFGVEGRF